MILTLTERKRLGHSKCQQKNSAVSDAIEVLRLSHLLKLKACISLL